MRSYATEGAGLQFLVPRPNISGRWMPCSRAYSEHLAGIDFWREALHNLISQSQVADDRGAARKGAQLVSVIAP